MLGKEELWVLAYITFMLTLTIFLGWHGVIEIGQ